MTTTTTTTTGGGEECGMLATYEECDDCECEKNLAGCDSFSDLEDEYCACGAGTPCEAACANYCATDDFDTPCEECFDNLADDDPCWDATYAACEADPACNAYDMASETNCGALP
jgi:hypothetical protein